MLNFPLLLVSALFFLALSSGLYVGAWSIATILLRAGRARISHAAVKRGLLTALILPPIAAAVTTLGGATLRHLHDRALMEHHSAGCQALFVRLFAVANGPGEGALTRDVLGALVNGAAWLLVGVGIVLAARLFVATVRLERGLSLFQSVPSPRLAGSLARIGARFAGVPAHRFFECPVPLTYSSVLGFWQARCVVSRAFIAEATDDELDAVVAHEASHLRSGDVRATFLVGTLNCFFFYLRPVRLLSRRWREAAELACDDQAVAATRKPLALASAILRVNGALSQAGQAGAGVPQRHLPAVALPFADEAACSPRKRVERLLVQAEHVLLPAPPRRNETRLQAVSGWALTLALAGIGAGALLSPATVCFAHCSLEAIARMLP